MQDPFSLKLFNPLHLFRILRHLPDFLKLYYRLFLDSRVPLYLKFLFIGGLLYIISPVDFLPDFLLPVLGGFDDIIILILVCKIFLSWSPRPIVLEHVARIDREGS